MTNQERVDNYKRETGLPQSLFVDETGRINGVFIMGNDYTTTGEYGAYPHGYLKRMNALFPDRMPSLQLFSVSLPRSDEYIRFDINSKAADVVGDAHKLSEHFLANEFRTIYADPAYSEEDSEHYGHPLINRNKVVKECVKILQPEGFLIWLDQVLPMYRKDELTIMGVIGMVKSTNHRFRVITIFQKQGI
jgi:hypothetical protein